MLFAVDIGNTQTAIGMFNGTQTPVYSARIATNTAQTTDELHVLIRSLLDIHAIEVSAIDHLIISSVVPALTEQWTDLGSVLHIRRVTVVNAQQCGDLAIKLEVPSEAGADRLANAVGAKTRYGSPAIVVDFGTATNIDIIDADGAYRGGVISPGLETSASALFSHAARLCAVDLIAPKHVIGTSTKSAVQSGLMFGEVAKVDGLVTRVIHELGDTPVVIATGGLAQTLAPMCSVVDHIDADLTLFGLYAIAQQVD